MNRTIKTADNLPVKTQGNFVVTGEAGERVAAFAMESDAALFAAAPDMLAELRKAESFISSFEGDELQEGIADLLAGIRTAIVKAEGAA